MKINFTNKTNKNTIYLVINGKHKIKNKELKSYTENFKFEKWEDFKIDKINVIENNKKQTNILIFIKNEKKLLENIEDIVIKLWNEIISANDKFNMSFKLLKLDIQTQEIFIELLAHKLYKFSDFKEDKSKYSINIDSNVDENKIINKIESIYFARNLMNMPANILNPETYEEKIKEAFKNNKNIKIKVIKWKELKKIWAGGIYAVWKWSSHEPRMIILEYKINKENRFDALIWKWVTFDSGGYNIKPTWYMEDMHLDMWGSAVSLWIFKHLVETWYNKNLICAVWIVENLVSEKAYSPTDIIKMYNWKTVQIFNTDAEWRLVLADTLSYVEDKYKINNIFDFATLTGAAVVALGEDITVIEWRNEKLLNHIKTTSWALKEPTWELPLFKKYKNKLKSNFADISNCSKSRWAWTITAWLFLSEFVKSKNWIHFDIAWPEITENHSLYWTWWSGVMIRTIVEVLKKIN